MIVKRRWVWWRCFKKTKSFWSEELWGGTYHL